MATTQDNLCYLADCTTSLELEDFAGAKFYHPHALPDGN